METKKIVHIMLAGPVTDGWNYQDNLLTKYHRRLGHEVTMITSQWVWGENGALTKCEKTDYRNESDVKVIRLPICGKDCWGRKFKRFKGLPEAMEQERPDVLFVHGVSFMDLDKVIHYIKRRSRLESAGKTGGLTVYVDNHSDLSNSGKSWVSRNILHRGIWKIRAKGIIPYVKAFFGVMPSRVDWLVQMYGFPREKCELLVLGADDDKIKEAAAKDARSMIRRRYGIADQDFLLMTGGKIDLAKRQTLCLMEAVKEIAGEYPVRLLVFGPVVPELEKQVEELADGKIVQAVGWIPSAESYDYFSAADLVVFPGRHSVYWEQVVGMEIPLLCKYWEGTTHVDIGGNVQFLYQDSAEEIRAKLEMLLKNNRRQYEEMLIHARSEKAAAFSYLAIAERCC